MQSSTDLNDLISDETTDKKLILHPLTKKLKHLFYLMRNMRENEKLLRNNGVAFGAVVKMSVVGHSFINLHGDISNIFRVNVPIPISIAGMLLMIIWLEHYEKKNKYKNKIQYLYELFSHENSLDEMKKLANCLYHLYHYQVKDMTQSQVEKFTYYCFKESYKQFFIQHPLNYRDLISPYLLQKIQTEIDEKIALASKFYIDDEKSETLVLKKVEDKKRKPVNDNNYSLDQIENFFGERRRKHKIQITLNGVPINEIRYLG